ncbi:MAG: hypothetical protein MUF58_18125 [Arcicella sp.]|jgi:hypothetical protein|nr:hypothetical protein [Arcicella sp.]
MLIQKIQEDPILSKFLCDDCEENGVGINIGTEVKRDDFIIIRVDEFYNKTVHDDSRPKSPDCLIIQHCGNNRFVLYLIELKAIKSLKTENMGDIRDKFQNCFSDFMSDRFREYFYNTDYEFVIKLYFISDPRETKIDKGKATRMDSLLALRQPRFANRIYPIKPKNPNPIIQPCQ